MLKQRETRMTEDGKDLLGLQTTSLPKPAS